MPYSVNSEGKTMPILVNNNSRNGNSVTQHRTGPVLMVAEKPSVARAVANNYPYRFGAVRERRVKAPPAPPHHSKIFKERIDEKLYSVYEFDGRLPGDSTTRKFKVISTLGHVLEHKFDKKFGDRLNTGGYGELFTADVEKLDTTLHQRMTNFINAEADGCDDLILWLDCDKHGETICVEVIDVIGLRPDDCRVRRARYFGLTKVDVKRAIDKLDDVDVADALSVNGLMEADLRIGCAFTRFFNQLYADYLFLFVETISYGPCQTPALAFIVDQFRKVDAFKRMQMKEWFEYKLTCTLAPSTGNGPPIKVKCYPANEERAEWLKGILESREWRDCDVQIHVEEKSPDVPAGLDTWDLLRRAAKELKLLPDEAAIALENIYIRGMISYPRSESTRYPTSYFETDYIRDVLKKLERMPEHRQLAKKLSAELDSMARNPRVTKSVGAHPPVMPFGIPEEHRRKSSGVPTKTEEQLLEKIIEWFLQGLAANRTEKIPAAYILVDGERLDVILDPSQDIDLETLNGRQYTVIKEVQVETRNCSPQLMSVEELIGKMEEYRIGTNGSVATHIRSLFDRNYVEVVNVDGVQRLNPTKYGIDLIDLFEDYAPKLIDPNFRSEMEAEMNKIETEEQLRSTVDQWVRQYEKMFKEFSAACIKWQEKNPRKPLMSYEVNKEKTEKAEKALIALKNKKLAGPNSNKPLGPNNRQN